MIEIILSIGIVAVLILFLSSILHKDHALLKFLLVIFLFILCFLIGKASIDAKDDCSLLLNFTNETENAVNLTETSFHYSTYCINDTTQTATLFYKTTLWLFRLFGMYAFLYIIYLIMCKYDWLPKKWQKKP